MPRRTKLSLTGYATTEVAEDGIDVGIDVEVGIADATCGTCDIADAICEDISVGTVPVFVDNEVLLKYDSGVILCIDIRTSPFLSYLFTIGYEFF